MSNLSQKHHDMILGAVSKVLKSVSAGQPSFRYFQNKSRTKQFFWTTERVNNKGHPRYLAGMYLFKKKDNVWKLVSKAGFVKKKRAKLWAFDHYQKDLTKGTKYPTVGA